MAVGFFFIFVHHHSCSDSNKREEGEGDRPRSGRACVAHGVGDWYISRSYPPFSQSCGLYFLCGGGPVPFFFPCLLTCFFCFEGFRFAKIRHKLRKLISSGPSSSGPPGGAAVGNTCSRPRSASCGTVCGTDFRPPTSTKTKKASRRGAAGESLLTTSSKNDKNSGAALQKVRDAGGEIQNASRSYEMLKEKYGKDCPIGLTAPADLVKGTGTEKMEAYLQSLEALLDEDSEESDKVRGVLR